MFATFKTVESGHEEFIEAGEQLVTMSKLKVTVEGSPVPVELFTGLVWGFKEGKISEYAGYYDPREALEAVGLSE